MIRGLKKSDVVGMGLGSGGGFHSTALGWEAEAGMDETRSYFQLSLQNHFWGSLKLGCGQGRDLRS